MKHETRQTLFLTDFEISFPSVRISKRSTITKPMLPKCRLKASLLTSSQTNCF